MKKEYGSVTAAGALERIHFAEETGDYMHVGRCVRWFDELISTTGDDEQKAELSSMRGRLGKAEEHMRVHGPDSLLDRGHPFVQQMLRIRKQPNG